MAGKLKPLENPYAVGGRWYKGAFHFHTTCSDGKIPPEAAVRKYVAKGFKLIGISDHGHVTIVDNARFPGVLLIPTAEIGWPHVLHIGAKRTGKLDIWKFRPAVAHSRREGGFSVVCHPDWSNHTWKEMVAAAGEVHALEVYNHVTELENACGTSRELWDLLLRSGRKLWGFADDDSHFRKTHPWYGGGWVMVKSPRLDKASILRALKAGSYYSSQGPEFRDISVRGRFIHVRCSPVGELRAVADGVGAGCVFFSRKPRSHWVVDRGKFMWKETTYLRLEIRDRYRRTAWSNPLFVSRRK